MTNESNHNDPGVSATYRNLARETTPPELDRKILSMAATGSRSRYGLARAWIRPVAWAATIGLSLAFVLEMSQLRDAPMQQMETSSEPAGSVEILKEVVIQDEAPARTSTPAAKQTALSPVAASPATDDPAPQVETELLRDKASLSVEFEADDMSMLQEAEEQARARVGSAQAPVEAIEAARFDAAISLEKKEKSEACDAQARTSGETWYACIEDLRRNGAPVAADTELEALRIEFPEFEEPGQNK